MKIVLTGSIGRINLPLAKRLLDKGHALTIISSAAERQPTIEALGAKAAIGSVMDEVFLKQTFTGADIVYLMKPPFDFTNQSLDPFRFWRDISTCYFKAVQAAQVKKIVHLSSIGAYRSDGVGILGAHYEAEKILTDLPKGFVTIKQETHMRRIRRGLYLDFIRCHSKGE